MKYYDEDQVDNTLSKEELKLGCAQLNIFLKKFNQIKLFSENKWNTFYKINQFDFFKWIDLFYL